MKVAEARRAVNTMQSLHLAAMAAAEARLNLKTSFKTLAMLAVAIAGIAPCRAASIVIVPPGLAPGTQYRLVFMTAGYANAESASITDYNTFVTTEADKDPALQALGATWSVIGSTATISAIANIGTPQGPVYDVVGDEIASSTASMFSATRQPLLFEMEFDQFGDVVQEAYVWTGTNPDGTPATSGGTSNTPLYLGSASGAVEVGVGACCPGQGYPTDQWLSGTVLNPEFNFQLYAISSALTVPLAAPTVPEPSSGLMVLWAAAVFLAVRRRRHTHGANRTTSPRNC